MLVLDVIEHCCKCSMAAKMPLIFGSPTIFKRIGGNNLVNSAVVVILFAILLIVCVFDDDDVMHFIIVLFRFCSLITRTVESPKM